MRDLLPTSLCTSSREKGEKPHTLLQAAGTFIWCFYRYRFHKTCTTTGKASALPSSNKIQVDRKNMRLLQILWGNYMSAVFLLVLLWFTTTRIPPGKTLDRSSIYDVLLPGNVQKILHSWNILQQKLDKHLSWWMSPPCQCWPSEK